MTLTKEDRLAAIEANMDAKQKLINEIDRKIKRTYQLIEEKRESNLDTQVSFLALENQLAGYLRDRTTKQAEWQKMLDEAKGLS